MRNKIFLLIVTMVLILGSNCFAAQIGVVGGVRDGLALGLMMENKIADNTDLRLGLEAATSNSLGIAFIGGKWFLNNINGKYPLSLSAGLVGYLGNNVGNGPSGVGPYISIIFNRFLDVKPLFLECGIDVVSPSRLQLQLGYYF